MEELHKEVEDVLNATRDARKATRNAKAWAIAALVINFLVFIAQLVILVIKLRQ
ncbi:MAG: hypothetical protein ACLRZ7_01020 [Lachnospiraceae bacterium]